jgi:hypothetical protein
MQNIQARKEVTTAIEIVNNIIFDAYDITKYHAWLENKELSKDLFPHISKHLNVIFKDEEIVKDCLWTIIADVISLISDYEDLTKYYPYVLKAQELAIKYGNESQKSYFANYIRGSNAKSLGCEYQFPHLSSKLSIELM